MPKAQSQSPSASVPIKPSHTPRTPHALCSLIDNSQLSSRVPHVPEYAFGPRMLSGSIRPTPWLHLPCRAKVVEALPLLARLAHAPALDLFSSRLRDLVVSGDLFGGCFEAAVDGGVEGSAEGFSCALDGDGFSRGL